MAGRQVIYFGSVFWSSGRAPVLVNWVLRHAPWVALGLSAVIAALVAYWRSKAPARMAPWVRTPVFFGVLWPVVATLPLAMTYLSLRHVYTASAGIIVGTVVLLVHLLPRRSMFVAVVSVIALACGWELRGETAAWRASSARSREASQALTVVASRAAPGDALFIDVPDKFAGKWLWSWSSPFALQPPFQSKDLAGDFIVLERPPVYFYPAIWSAHPSIERLRRHTGAGWIVSAGTGRDMSVSRVTPERLQAALTDPGLRLGEEGSFERLMAMLRVEGAP